MLSSQKNANSLLSNQQRFLTPLSNKSVAASKDKLYTTVGPQLRIEDDQVTAEYSGYRIPTKETSGKKTRSSSRLNQSPNLFGKSSRMSSNAFLGQMDPLQTLQQQSTVESSLMGANQQTL